MMYSFAGNDIGNGVGLSALQLGTQYQQPPNQVYYNPAEQEPVNMMNDAGVRDDQKGKNTSVGLPVNPSLVLTTETGPRLRWSPELHQHFVYAVAALGGPGKASPKRIQRIMNVKGLTLFHLKSHLQKYRLARQSKRDARKATNGDGNSIVRKSNGILGDYYETSTSFARPRGIKEARAFVRAQVEMHKQGQLEMQRKQKLQAEVERHVEIRRESEERYVDFLPQRTYQMFDDQSLTKGIIPQWINDPAVEVTTQLPTPTPFICDDPFGIWSMPPTNPTAAVEPVIPGQFGCSIDNCFLPLMETFQSQWTDCIDCTTAGVNMGF